MLTRLRWTAYSVEAPKGPVTVALWTHETLLSTQHCPALQGPRAVVRGHTTLSLPCLP